MKLILVAIVSLVLSGCGLNKTYYISSEPEGATVFSGEVVYGVTPFETDLNTILPYRHIDFKPAATRMLLFEKDGYLPGNAIIREYSAGGNVHVILKKEKSSTENELREIKSLHEKGLITREEYDAKRAEILQLGN